MKLWMRIAMPVATVMTFTGAAQAQQQWGTGYYGGMQSCPYQYGAAEGSSSIQDEIAEKQEAIKEAKYQMKSKSSELKTLDRRRDRYRSDVEEVIAAEYADQVLKHIDNNFKACQYKGMEVQAQGNQGGVAISTCGADTPSQDISGFTVEQWAGVIDSRAPGQVNGSVCTTYKNAEKGRRTTQDCQKALVEYKKSTDKRDKLAREVEDLDRSIDMMKEDIADLKKDYREEQREAARERRENPEGDFCPGCAAASNGYSYRKSESNVGSAITNVALGALAIGGGIYMGNKSIDAAANLGFTMDPYQTYGMGLGLGLPFVASGLSQALGGNGLYGTVAGGVGAGGFGCQGNNGGPYGMMGPYGGANGQGMWGNPYAMGGNPYGGGMYGPGMGPWGMNGPMGGMMGGYPGGMMMAGGGGIMMGGMAGGMMPGMMMGNMMGGGAMMGNMMGGMMPGMMMSGGGGIMMGGMAGGMMPGMMMGSMSGGMMPGMMMGGMAGGMVGGMMPGMMAGGMMPGMMMGGMAGGMMPGMMVGGMAGGMMPGMGMMGADLGAFQMQQQMMQMQMNQYQQMMQQQMQKQQVTASLQQELYGLMYRIQQVQYGFGTNYLSGGIGGGGSIGGAIPAPGYGNGGYNGGYNNGGAIPAPGYNNGGSGTGNGGVILAPR